MTDRRTLGLGRAALAVFVLTAAVLSARSLPVVVVCTVVALGATIRLPAQGWPGLWGALVVGAPVTVLSSGTAGSIGWFTLCGLAGWCALVSGTGPALVFTGAAVTTLVVQATLLSSDPGWAAWIAGTVFTVVVCLMAQRQQGLVDELRVAQAGLAERVRAEERVRIAHELHDVIAHSLTVSLLHVGSARLAVRDAPMEAADALAQAEQHGRDALTEVRRAVGLLHTGPGPLTPLPGAAQLPELVDSFRRAGAAVDFEVIGEPGRLPETTGLTLYRILQESLTNASRHAAGSTSTVRLEVGGRTTELTVDSAGAPREPRGEGLGLTGMRERALALGGELTAGPSGTGWRVRAVLPGPA